MRLFVTTIILLMFLSGCAIQKSKAVLPSHRDKDYKSRTKDDDTSKKSDTQTSSGTTSKVSTKTTSLKKAADSYLGVRYKYGGTTRKGIDCSGLIWRVFLDVGHKDFQRTSSTELYKMGKSVSRTSLKQGDLCFFGPGRKVNHVGIYMGNNKFIHASSSKGVTYSSLDNVYWRPRIIGFRRLY